MISKNSDAKRIVEHLIPVSIEPAFSKKNFVECAL
jgi:hypothetical protein